MSSSPPQLTISAPSERRSAGFDPSMWRDYFLVYSSHNMAKEETAELEVERLKVEVQEMLMTYCQVKLFDKLDLIDQIQRLGIGYHFETEIDQLLNMIQTNYVDDDSRDLCTTALMFRLLRQQGHYISGDIFQRFMDENGNFHEFLTQDVKGLLSLYEASYLKIHGEEILEKALDFSTTHLNKYLQQKGASLAAQVRHALQMNLHKRTTRLLARDSIDLYQERDSPNQVLLSLAKLSFNLLQKLHQTELGHLSRWWKSLDMGTKLPFARDRLVECYIWALAVYFEPQHSFCRKTLTKVITLTSLMDDIYDLYGTIQELSLLTSVIQRWEIERINELPEFMQHFLLAFVDVIDEIEDRLVREGRQDYVRYAKEAVRRSSMVPPISHANPGRIHVRGSNVGYLSFLQPTPTKESLDWLLHKPKMLLGSSIVGRLTNDIASYKPEKKRGDAPSAVECYMKQHHVSEEEAVAAMHMKLDEAWNDMNESCLLVPEPVSRSLLFPLLNWARACYVFYTDHEDLYTSPNTAIKDLVESVIINPVGV